MHTTKCLPINLKQIADINSDLLHYCSRNRDTLQLWCLGVLQFILHKVRHIVNDIIYVKTFDFVNHVHSDYLVKGSHFYQDKLTPVSSGCQVRGGVIISRDSLFPEK